MTDITFKTDSGYFIYKAGAIIIHEKKVLMVKNEAHPFYYTVGGRVNFGESSQAAVLRETFEETGINFEIDRLAFIHENFFYDIDSAFDAPAHEIALYYLMKPLLLSDIESMHCNSLGFGGVKESLHWLPLDKLSEYRLYPEFYKTELLNMKKEVNHFITKNGNIFCAE